MGTDRRAGRTPRRVLAALAAAAVAALAPAGAGAADLEDPAAQWLPRQDGAEWVYGWSNSAYSPGVTLERYALSARTGTSFRISWQQLGTGPYDVPAAGFADYRHTDAGLVNANYQSTAPPPQFPVLCASASQCGNSLAGAHFLMLWGNRSLTVAEPLVAGSVWNAVGGAAEDVASTNRYLGTETIAVPAFPGGVLAAKIESDISQTGALGDPFGSGVRTTWWVYGVGPVRVRMQHAGGETSVAELQSTTLAPAGLPPDANLLPLAAGTRASFRWRNSEHMRRWSRQRATVTRVLNGTARVELRDRGAGPVDVSASYVFASRISGLTNLSSARASGSTRARFPRLGPKDGLEGRRRFLTPYDLMIYGFNPVLTAYTRAGDSWRSSRETREWRRFGVVGVSTVLGARSVRTPAGRFDAVAVRSTLRQPGVEFGSGTRTMWFAPGRGLVKLTFAHDDGSTSTVERIR